MQESWLEPDVDMEMEYLNEASFFYTNEMRKLVFTMTEKNFVDDVCNIISWGYMNGDPDSIKLAEELGINELHIYAFAKDIQEFGTRYRGRD